MPTTLRQNISSKRPYDAYRQEAPRASTSSGATLTKGHTVSSSRSNHEDQSDTRASSHSSTTSSSTSPPLNFFEMSPAESQREAMRIAEELRESGSLLPFRYLIETDEEAVKKRIKLEQKELERALTLAESIPQKDLISVKKELDDDEPLFPTDSPAPPLAEQENDSSRSSSAQVISDDIDMKPPLVIDSRSPSSSLSISDPTETLPDVLPAQLNSRASTSSSETPDSQMTPLSDFSDSLMEIPTVHDERSDPNQEEEGMEEEDDEEIGPRKFSRSPGPEFEVKPCLKEESPALHDSLMAPLEGEEELKDEDNGSLWDGDDDTDSSLTPLEDEEEMEDEGDTSLWEGDDNVDELVDSQEESDNARSRSPSEESPAAITQPQYRMLPLKQRLHNQTAEETAHLPEEARVKAISPPPISTSDKGKRKAREATIFLDSVLPQVELSTQSTRKQNPVIMWPPSLTPRPLPPRKPEPFDPLSLHPPRLKPSASPSTFGSTLGPAPDDFDDLPDYDDEEGSFSVLEKTAEVEKDTMTCDRAIEIWYSETSPREVSDRRSTSLPEKVSIQEYVYFSKDPSLKEADYSRNFDSAYNHDILTSDIDFLIQAEILPASLAESHLLVLPEYFSTSAGMKLVLEEPGGAREPQKYLDRLWDLLTEEPGINPKWKPERWMLDQYKRMKNTLERWRDFATSFRDVLGYEVGVEELDEEEFLRQMQRTIGNCFGREGTEAMLNQVLENNWIWYEHIQELTLINLASNHLASETTIIRIGKYLVSKMDEFNSELRKLEDDLRLEQKVDKRGKLEFKIWMMKAGFEKSKKQANEISTRLKRRLKRRLTEKS